MNYKYLYESMLKYLDEGVLVVDTDANVTYYNEPAKNIAGIDPEEAIGKNILDIFPDLTPKTSTFYYVLNSGKPLVDYVQSYMNYKGEKVTTVTSTIPLMKDDKIIGALEIYRNVTDVKKLYGEIASLQKKLFIINRDKKNSRGNGTIYTLENLIGQSNIIRELKVKACKIADSRSPVMIYGETGTGKEILVQGIHNASLLRRNKPFIAQNCAAIPHSLLEGILFGTCLGSFTGAIEKPGIFELANGGTLFLDEINSMDIELQAKLLRVLQDGVLRRIGGTKTVTLDVRVIAATNEEPLQSVRKKSLREDLYYRLNVIYLNIIPLRERKEDISLLVNYFISMYNKKLNMEVESISKGCLDIILNYNWPGNVRQLKYMIESMMNFIDGNIIGVEDLPSNIVNYDSSFIEEKKLDKINNLLPPLKEAINKYEKELIERAVEQANGNFAKAARLLKIPKQTLHNKIKKNCIKGKYIIN